MSILSSTNSGMQTPITEEFLLSSSWEINIDLAPIKVYRYIHINLQPDKNLYITFDYKSKCYLYKGKCQNINIYFYLKTIGDLQDLISYYLDVLKDPIEAILKTKNNKNVEWFLDCETADHVALSNESFSSISI